MNLFDSNVITINYQDKGNLLTSVWKQCDNSEQFIDGIKGCKEVCDKTKVHNALWHFNDFSFIIPPDLQKWKDDFLNRGVIQKAGVFNKLAFVVGKDLLALLSGVEPIENSVGVITPRCFTNETQALDYIHTPHKQEDIIQTLLLPKLSIQRNDFDTTKSQILIDVNSEQVHEYLFILNRLFKSKTFGIENISKFLQLTKTEREILKLIISGYTNEFIAKCRHVAYETIKTHRKNIFRKLACRNTRELAKYSIFISGTDSLY